MLPPAADAVEMELRRAIGAFSILGILTMDYEILEKRQRWYVDRKEHKNWLTEATESCIMIMIKFRSVNESDRAGARGRKYPDNTKNEGTLCSYLNLVDSEVRNRVKAMYFIQSVVSSRKGYLHQAEANGSLGEFFETRICFCNRRINPSFTRKGVYN